MIMKYWYELSFFIPFTNYPKAMFGMWEWGVWIHVSHFPSHPFSCLDSSSEDENEINNDSKGNEILLISGISIHSLVGGILIP